MEVFYQFFTPGSALLETAVQAKCSATPSRLRTRPVTGWISQLQAASKHQVAFWTREGLLRYIQSGLLGWQCSVAESEIVVKEFVLTGTPDYVDAHQVLAQASAVRQINAVDLITFLHELGFHNIKQKVIVYVTRGETEDDQEVMVFQRTTKNAVEVPCQELMDYEHPCEGSFRSLQEQSGIKDQISFRKLGLAYSYDFQLKEFEALHYFQSPLHCDVPEHWSMPSRGRPDKLEFSWLPVGSAKSTLPSWQAQKLDLVQ